MDYFDILLAKKLNGGGGGDIDLQTLNVTENGTVNAPSGVAYNKVITNVPAPANAIYKQTISNLPSPIATFNGADAPLDSLKASIVGVQDLHGYDKPWPAAGGKNKYPYSENLSDDTWRINSGGTYNITNNVLYVGCTSTIYSGVYCNGTALSLIREQAVDVTVSFDIKANVNTNIFALRATIPVTTSFVRKSVTVSANDTSTPFAFYGMETAVNLEIKNICISYDGNTTYSPYSNICPISGWSEANVLNRGKNWLSTNFTEGKSINSSGAVIDNSSRSATVEVIRVIPNTTYTVSYTGSNRWGWIAYNSNGEKINSASWLNSGDSFTTPVGTYNIRLYTDSGTAPTNVQLELGEEATTYEPYNGNTYTILFKDSSDNPLTVYYGNIDISNGKLIVTHIGEFYDGSSDEGWEKRGTPNQYFRITVANAGTYVDGSIKCNQFEYSNVTNNNTNIGITVATVSTNQVIGARPSNYLDLSLEDWKTQLATNPLQVIYELVTPLEYDLTPLAIRSNGVTNISVDCGEVTELKYYSDTP